MKRVNLFILLIMLCLMCSATTVSAGGSMKITSVERYSKKNIKVYFKPVKEAKIYKVEYYYEKGNNKISKAYYKLFKKSKVKRSKDGRSYVIIPAKAPIQYASISYRKAYYKGEWKKWSGYEKAKCKHNFSKPKVTHVDATEDEVGYTITRKTCKRCKYVVEDIEEDEEEEFETE